MGEKLPIWQQNGLLLPERKNKIQLFTQEPANYVGEEILLAILSTETLVKGRRQKTDDQELKRTREQGALPSVVKAKKREMTGRWPNEVSMGIEAM